MSTEIKPYFEPSDQINSTIGVLKRVVFDGFNPASNAGFEQTEFGQLKAVDCVLIGEIKKGEVVTEVVAIGESDNEVRRAINETYEQIGVFGNTLALRRK